MPTSLLVTPNGQSYSLVVSGAAVSGPLTITGNPTPDSCYLLNPGATSVAVTFTKLNASAAPSGFRFPTQAGPSVIQSVILPPLMQTPMQVKVPSGGFNAFGIGVSPTSVTIYFTPAELQS